MWPNIAALGIAVSLVVFSFARSPFVALSAIAFAGFFHVICNISMQSMAQLMSAPAMRGRVLALYTLIFRAAPALGAFVIGWLAVWLELQPLIGIAAAVFALLVLAVIPSAISLPVASRPRTTTQRAASAGTASPPISKAERKTSGGPA